MSGLLFGLSHPISAQDLSVAAAANVRFALEELEKAFEKKTKLSININYSSSGKLSTQIIQGAPFDVFVSADEEYPQSLQKAGVTANIPKVYAQGTLVLWTTKSGLSVKADGKILLSNKVQKIAIANPKTAPYGRAAIEWLKKKTLYTLVENKLVYGESIAQTTQYILAGACEIGLTAKSMVMAGEMRGKGTWVEIDARYYEPIRQAAVITTFGQKKHPQASRVFFDFLFSAEAQKIWKKHGYK
ncbi:molybdate ABC transporter substrate-binding protein [Haliscomenobacter hydrossis]|uniref:molybdate ABC transporter substrate-binding protein n=1 Tax=Haliscomenobacter hydrossis TaxID=2350 RepID=UPI0005C5412D|nr:molybdate ABC transporter substrate-binding protein [Haliscomenobacter hydrossis]